MPNDYDIPEVQDRGSFAFNSIGRRHLLQGGAVIGLVLALGLPRTASAAAAWRHPFASRKTPNKRYGPGYPEYTGGIHKGLDYDWGSGTQIYSVASGTVVAAGWGAAGQDWAGNGVLVRHADGYHSYYAHMSSIDVSSGDSVSAGSRIGKVGSTGRSTGPHLHIEIWESSSRSDHTDPYPLIHNAPLAGSQGDPDMPTFFRHIDTRTRTLTPGEWYNVNLSNEGGTSFATGKCMVQTTVVVRLAGLDVGNDVQFRLVRTIAGTNTIKDGTAVREASGTPGTTSATVSDSFRLTADDDGLRWQYTVFQSGVTVDRTEVTGLIFG